jgi:hypothetical protein
MSNPIYSAKDEQKLMSEIWAPEVADNPEAFVLFMFPWGRPNTPLANFKGPRLWQRKVLRLLADHIKYNNGILVPDDWKKLQLAIASGRGIGKSALVSWIILWMLSTRIGASVIVSANSEAQLKSVTWGELTKWHAMAINSHWWDISATKLMPAKWVCDLVERDLKKGTRYWCAEGKLWSEENPDSYVGAHNHDGMLLIFDEASGIPDPIWAVSKGFFTERIRDKYWLVFSNPRRNSGYFFECFNAKRDFWMTETIDARTVEDTDKQVYEEILLEYGVDSQQAKVEVYGEFPDDDGDHFISHKIIDEAFKRPKWMDNTAPIIIGVDPAGSGSNADSTAIVVRKGRDLIYLKRYHGEDGMEIVGRVIEAIEMFQPVLTVIDEGGLGAPIIDRLKEQRYKVRGVNFGNVSKKPIMWANKRAEMWGAMREWLKSASIEPDKKLKSDLVGPTIKYKSSGAIILESKRDMRSRGLSSPDAADALAVTFAYPIANYELSNKRKSARTNNSDSSYTMNSWMAS